MAESPVSVRFPSILLSRINEDAEKRGVRRNPYIVEACRAFLDGSEELPVRFVAPAAQLRAIEANQDPKWRLVNPSLHLSIPSRKRHVPLNIPGVMTGAQLMAGHRVDLPDSDGVEMVAEIPLCLNLWWNNDPERGDGEQYECHSDKGHKGNCSKGRMM